MTQAQITTAKKPKHPELLTPKSSTTRVTRAVFGTNDKNLRPLNKMQEGK